MIAQILKRAVPIAIAGAICGGGTASAFSDDTTTMPLGAQTAPPMGFVEMCERTPTECLTARPTDQRLADVRDWAGRARWASVFQSAGIGAIAPSPIIDVRPSVATSEPATITTAPLPPHPKAATPEEIRALKDERRKRRSSAARKVATAAASGSGASIPAPEPSPDVSPVPSRPVADISVAALEAVSRRLNRAIRRASDADAYGLEDVWALPDGPRPAGDCEDYVLAKRRALIEVGVDPATLSIAIVRTRRGEIHAVLLVATTDGEQVLDNLSPWVLPWREAPYEWLERQAPGQPRVWIRAAV